MGTMELLLNDVENHFGISDAKAGSLLSSVLGFIQEQNGGLSGFLDRFRRIGLSDAVSGWLGGGPTTPLSADNLQSALGTQAMNSIAARSGLSISMVTAALAYMLPKLVRSLAPGGTIPTRLPSEAAPYLTRASGMVTEGARDTVRAVERRGSASWLWPLLAFLAVLLALVFWPRKPRTFNVQTPTFNIQDQVRIASEKAGAALAALEPGFSGQELTSALNLEIINFATGSAQIPDSSTPFLDKAAEAMKLAPSGIGIQIGGHTDNVGDSAANMTLSQQRADAVRDYLIQRGVPASQLTSRGFGDTQPVASNNTEEGRFRNRRIEFTVR